HGLCRPPRLPPRRAHAVRSHVHGQPHRREGRRDEGPADARDGVAGAGELRSAEGSDGPVTTGYVPIVILTVLAGAFAVLSLAASALLRPKRSLPAKSAPYECGIEPVRLPKSERFPVKFYVVAMLFIIFDIEAIFLYPWAVA